MKKHFYKEPGITKEDDEEILKTVLNVGYVIMSILMIMLK